MSSQFYSEWRAIPYETTNILTRRIPACNCAGEHILAANNPDGARYIPPCDDKVYDQTHTSAKSSQSFVGEAVPMP